MSRTLLSTVVSVAAIFTGFLLLQNPTSTTRGQERIPSSRKPACGCYVCGKLLAAQFPNKAPDCAGILAEDACPTAMREQNLSPEQRSAFCEKLRGGQTPGGLRTACPAYASICGDEPAQTRCEKPTPWFDNSATPGKGCKDFQAPTVKVEEGIAYLQMCGTSVFAHTLPSTDVKIIESYQRLLLEHVQKAIGKGVCCDKFRPSVGSGSACDPRFDLDCDGRLNPSDRTPDGLFPDISLGTVASGVSSSNIDPLPPWVMENYSSILPPVTLCDCKWELLKGTRTCSPDGVRSHVYQARWRCPSTGNERFTRREAPPYESCGSLNPSPVGLISSPWTLDWWAY